MKRVAGAGLVVSILFAVLAVVSLGASNDACTSGWTAPTDTAGRMCELLRETNDLVRLDPGFVVFLCLAVVFAAMGALILVRAGGHRIGLVLLSVGMLLLAGPAFQGYAKWALIARPGALPGGAAAAWVASVTGGPVLFSLIGAFFLLFPTGRIPSRRWRPVAWLLTATGIASVLFFMLTPGGLTAAPLVENPLGIPALEPVLDVLGAPVFLVLVASVILSMISVAVRFRRSRDVERQQLKWVGASALVVGLTLASTPIIFTTPSLNGLWIVLFPLAAATIPISAAVAILKYRLYDIDVIVNRTLVYAALTAVLVATYAGGVLIFRTILDPVTGDNDIAIAASTLAVAALFGPARRRVQAFIDRRFYRSRYDAQQTLEAFGARLRDEVDLNTLSADILGVVSDTVQPRHASVWLRTHGAGS
jgi:MFS family permease